MAQLIPFDMSWAAVSYLLFPSGRLCYIRGLDIIAADASALGARMFWADVPVLGCCDIESRTVLLSPRLEYGWPACVRRVLTHELLHLRCGRDDERVRWMQSVNYDELVAA